MLIVRIKHPDGVGWIHYAYEGKRAIIDAINKFSGYTRNELLVEFRMVV